MIHLNDKPTHLYKKKNNSFAQLEAPLFFGTISNAASRPSAGLGWLHPALPVAIVMHLVLYLLSQWPEARVLRFVVILHEYHTC